MFFDFKIPHNDNALHSQHAYATKYLFKNQTIEVRDQLFVKNALIRSGISFDNRRTLNYLKWQKGGTSLKAFLSKYQNNFALLRVDESVQFYWDFISSYLLKFCHTFHRGSQPHLSHLPEYLARFDSNVSLFPEIVVNSKTVDNEYVYM